MSTTLLSSPNCSYCGHSHSGVCPKIKSIKYNQYGQIESVTFKDDMPITSGPVSATKLFHEKEFEYNIHPTKEEINANILENLFNHYGRQGWELVGCFNTPISMIVFKREK